MAWRKEQPKSDALQVGEVPAMSVLVVVAPGWGRLRRGRLEHGNDVDHGTVIGELHEQGSQTILTAPSTGIFISWLASDGERVSPGMPIAQIGPSTARA